MSLYVCPLYARQNDLHDALEAAFRGKNASWEYTDLPSGGRVYRFDEDNVNKLDDVTAPWNTKLRAKGLIVNGTTFAFELYSLERIHMLSGLNPSDVVWSPG